MTRERARKMAKRDVLKELTRLASVAGLRCVAQRTGRVSEAKLHEARLWGVARRAVLEDRG